MLGLSNELAALLGVLILYFILQIVGNTLKLSRSGTVAAAIAFYSSLVSNAYLVLASLALALLMALDFRVKMPGMYPDMLLLVLGLVIYLLVFLLDVYMRLVLKKRRGTLSILDVDESFIVAPPSAAMWELALFNFVLLKGFAYEVYLRGFALTTLMAATDSPVLAIFLVAVIEFLLRPHGERLVPVVIVSALLSVVFYASSGLIVTIIIRVVGNYILSLYLVYLTIKQDNGGEA
jgi:hypothetical protein